MSSRRRSFPATKNLALAVGLAAGLVACSSGDDEGETVSGPPDEPLSAVLVTLDTTRADVLSCYGGPVGLSPQLDRLASEGILYEYAYTVVPLTLPAHASMLTGLYPPRHGLRINGVAPLPDSAETLAELAGAAGFQSAAFIAAVVLDRAFGLDQGFDTYDTPLRPVQATSVHLSERSGKDVVDDAIEWLRQRDRGRPFFLWVHLFDPHAPYEPPQRFLDLAPERPYVGEVAAADLEVGRLIDVLRADGGIDETLIMVVGDHGESLGEHDEPSHGPFCYEGTLRVPLIVRYPDEHRKGQRERAVASVVDVFPTLADAMQLPRRTDVDGRSLFYRELPADRGAYFESYYGHLAYGWSPLTGWIDASGKYMHSSEPQLFDPRSDELELADIIVERAPELERYRAGIRAVADAPALEPDSRGELDAAIRKAVGDLGYATIPALEGKLPDPLSDSDLPSPQSMVGVHKGTLFAMRVIEREQDFAKALVFLEEALKRNPTNYFAMDAKGLCLMKLDRIEEAIEPLMRVIANGPQWSHTYVRLGSCMRFQDRNADAIPYFQRALDIDPGNAEAIGNLVFLLQAEGRGDEAEPYRKRFNEFTGKLLPTAEQQEQREGG